jgi:hypothetical protein
MFGFFKKNKKGKESEEIQRTTLKSINYPPKIILAWAKVVEGNKDIASWLITNGYPEIVHVSSAIHLSDPSRDWLMKNGYAHLMAFVNAAEGNLKALNWIRSQKYDLLYQMAKAIDGDNDSWLWIQKNATADIFILTQAIKTVKDRIEDNHNDIHTFGRD